MAEKIQQENILKEIQNLASLGYWTWNITGDIFDCSSETLNLLQIDPADKNPTLYGFLSRVSEESRDRIKSLILETAETGKDFAIELSILSKEGKLIPIETRGRKIQKDENDSGFILGTIQNIELRKKAEEKISLYAKVFENTNEAIAVTNAAAQIIDVNPQYEIITGYNKDEIIGNDIHFLKSEKHDTEFFNGMWDSLKEKGYWKGEVWDRKKSGELFPKWLSMNQIQDSLGNTTHYVAIFSDISLIKESEEKISHIFYHNSLTGLPNNNRLHEILLDEEKSAIRYNHSIVLFDIILNNLNSITETYGNNFAEQAIQSTVKKLRKSIRDTDGIFHAGENEFIILFANITNTRNIAMKAEQILEELIRPVPLEQNEIYLSSNIGIAVYPEETGDIRNLPNNAFTAAGFAQKKGQNTYQFYTEEMNRSVSGRIKMESLMRQAVDNQEFELLYQPMIETAVGEIIGMEALLRWNNKELGNIMPSDFIPLAEETGIIMDIGEWILFMACSQLISAMDVYEKVPLNLSINLSTRQFRNPRLAAAIMDILYYTHFKPEWLELEITENLFMENMGSAIETIDILRESGIRIALDDFGTGYSSLSYLKNFPIDTLKIDKSFISDIGFNLESEAIVGSILSLGKGLGLKVVAEGVETEEQYHFLKNSSCDILQGYYFGKPVPMKTLMDSISSSG
ncbi:MAG: EAL domain-containing protein [Spirochaetia bacterium]|nr:EAL domain-containing protein [Spirochaetia bacterium]